MSLVTLLISVYLMIPYSVASTEGMTATCATAFGLPNLTNWNLRLLNLANNKLIETNKMGQAMKQLILACIMY